MEIYEVSLRLKIKFISNTNEEFTEKTRKNNELKIVNYLLWNKIWWMPKILDTCFKTCEFRWNSPKNRFQIVSN